MPHFGEHLTYDGYGGDYAALDCRATVMQALADLVAALGMTILGGPEVYRAPGSRKKHPDVYARRNGLDTAGVRQHFRQRFGMPKNESISRSGACATRYPTSPRNRFLL